MKKGGREARADQPYQPVTGESVVYVSIGVKGARADQPYQSVTGESVVCVSVGMGRVVEEGQGLTNHCGLRTSFIVAS